MVMVHKVPLSRTIVIRESNESRGFLELYFSNRERSGGGNVESLTNCDGYALATFADIEGKIADCSCTDRYMYCNFSL